MLLTNIDFDELEWDTSHPGARSKSYDLGNGTRMRLLELTDDFVEHHWCHKGHIGFVLRGTLKIDFRGRLVTYNTGNGLNIPPGETSAHKAMALTPVVRLILIEEA